MTVNNIEPKVFYCCPNASPQRCLVRLFKKYIGLLPATTKKKELYLHARARPRPNVWYEDRCLGINALRPMYNRLCELAGLKKGNYRNQSG